MITIKKRKILIWGITPYIGGVESYLITILQHINKNKFDIDLLTKEDITGINKEKINGNYNKIYKIPSFKKHPLKTIRFLKVISKDNQYDVVHFNICVATTSVYALIIKLFSKNTKVFIHSHNGSDNKKVRHYLFRPLLNRVADRKLSCSEVAANWMFGNSKEVIICNNFIDTDKFLFNEKYRNKLRTELNIENKFVLGHVGRFSNQKNHKELVDIFNSVTQDNNDVILILIGTGELVDSIKEYVNKLNINNKVLFLGVKSNTNEYYQAMDLFILPSLFEGLPIVAIEAQTSGLKCLLADTIDSNSDISGNVKFLPLNNIKLWKEEIENIIKNKYIRKDMKKIIIDRGYDLQVEIKKIEDLYLSR